MKRTLSRMSVPEECCRSDEMPKVETLGRQGILCFDIGLKWKSEEVEAGLGKVNRAWQVHLCTNARDGNFPRYDSRYAYSLIPECIWSSTFRPSASLPQVSYFPFHRALINPSPGAKTLNSVRQSRRASHDTFFD